MVEQRTLEQWFFRNHRVRRQAAGRSHDRPRWLVGEPTLASGIGGRRRRGNVCSGKWARRARTVIAHRRVKSSPPGGHRFRATSGAGTGSNRWSMIHYSGSKAEVMPTAVSGGKDLVPKVGGRRPGFTASRNQSAQGKTIRSGSRTTADGLRHRAIMRCRATTSGLEFARNRLGVSAWSPTGASRSPGGGGLVDQQAQGLLTQRRRVERHHPHRR